MMILDNIFAKNRFDPLEEKVQTLLCGDSVRIEKIVTSGQTTPKEFWYDQEEDEFILVLQGSAVIRFETESIALHEGDYLLIQAHKKHQVQWSDPQKITLWLAIFIKKA